MKIGAEIDSETGKLELLKKEDIDGFLMISNYGQNILKYLLSFSFPGVALFCLLKNICCWKKEKELICVVLLQSIGKFPNDLSAELLQNKLKNWKPCFYEDYNIGSITISLSEKNRKSDQEELNIYIALIKAHVENFLATANKLQQMRKNKMNQNNLGKVVVLENIPNQCSEACCKNCKKDCGTI